MINNLRFTLLQAYNFIIWHVYYKYSKKHKDELKRISDNALKIKIESIAKNRSIKFLEYVLSIKGESRIGYTIEDYYKEFLTVKK